MLPYMLPWVKLCPSLAYNDIARFGILICNMQLRQRWGLKQRGTFPPENSLRPNRCPGDDPWFEVTPPPFFVAYRTWSIIPEEPYQVQILPGENKGGIA
jgi:hypothetical protein